jgi:hypothetical protein
MPSAWILILPPAALTLTRQRDTRRLSNPKQPLPESSGSVQLILSAMPSHDGLNPVVRTQCDWSSGYFSPPQLWKPRLVAQASPVASTVSKKRRMAATYSSSARLSVSTSIYHSPRTAHLSCTSSTRVGRLCPAEIGRYRGRTSGRPSLRFGATSTRGALPASATWAQRSDTWLVHGVITESSEFELMRNSPMITKAPVGRYMRTRRPGSNRLFQGTASQRRCAPLLAAPEQRRYRAKISLAHLAG